jgi:dihydroorotase
MIIADTVFRRGRLIDPAHDIDTVADVAILSDRVVAVGAEAAQLPARREIDATGAIIAPGFIDMHVHVYEWVTNFGVNADQAGVHAGATTIVDQGSAGAWTLGGFKAYVADPARTDVRAFVSINLAGALQGGMQGPTLHNPDMVDIPSLLSIARTHPRLVRGIKCHWESGGLSRWGPTVLRRAAEAGREAGLPLYVHTGELFPVDEAARPAPDSVMAQVLPFLKPGDVLAHVYSAMPDGVMSVGTEVPDWVREAKAAGVLFDLGHGVNFRFAIARKMMEAGIFPDTLGSDVHGDFNAYHDNSRLDYSLIGGFNKMLALGMSLPAAIRALTATSARILADPAIGHLGVGARANITLLRPTPGAWTFYDSQQEALVSQSRLLPEHIMIGGDLLQPSCALLADVLEPGRKG